MLILIIRLIECCGSEFDLIRKVTLHIAVHNFRLQVKTRKPNLSEVCRKSRRYSFGLRPNKARKVTRG